jgi:hypothetical protein
MTPITTKGAVVALAGRRIDAESAAMPRFPFERIGQVRSDIEREFMNARAIALVCSAACGADLLALDVAQARDIPVHIILPFSAELFRNSSVIDRPHPEFWGDMFDRVVARARERGEAIELDYAHDDADAYLATNRAIIAKAKTLTAQMGRQMAAVAIIVWNGVARDAGDVTQQFADHARSSGFSVNEVHTL